jgi:hypothetical protein
MAAASTGSVALLANPGGAVWASPSAIGLEPRAPNEDLEDPGINLRLALLRASKSFRASSRNPLKELRPLSPPKELRRLSLPTLAISHCADEW